MKGAKKKLKIRWSCSDVSKHEHRFKFMAYLCGRIQYITAYALWYLKVKSL